MLISRSLFSFDLIRLPPVALFSIDERFDPFQASVISSLFEHLLSATPITD
jgi:hypothetical protein